MSDTRDHPANASPSGNPYQPPVQVGQPTLSTEPVSRLGPALAMGIACGLVGAVAVHAVYHDDPRTPNIPYWTILLLAGLFSGLMWAIAGALTGWNARRIGTAHLTAIGVGVIWVMVGGSYRDVISAAVSTGWPLAGVAAAAITSPKFYRRLGFGRTKDL